ncbi:MAG: twin-arginine translocase TatA/TatE family subunit, partial [Actinobacteria bacterium]|nr:twin-arginine translocase TatA/TatE family subunit [Actinomycetota bacterium]
MPFGFHPMYLVVLLVIVLVIFGPGKLPHLGGAIGKSLREFRRSAE